MAHGRDRKLLGAGTRAPDLTFKHLDGEPTTLREIVARGPALLAFFKVNCPVCQMAFPFLERIHAGDALAVYGISQNGEEDTRAFNRHFGLTLPTLLDTESSGFPGGSRWLSIPVVRMPASNSRLAAGSHRKTDKAQSEISGKEGTQALTAIRRARHS